MMEKPPIIAIRTHKWTDEEERLLASLREVEGHDLAVVFHNRPAGLKLPLDVIDIDDAWLAQNGFRVVPDWGWRCGDYFYYALRAARPDHDFYWLVEPDVHFAGPAADFFARFGDVQDDLLGYRIIRFLRNIAFARGLPGLELHQAIFAMTRLSGRAIDRLAERRRAYGSGDVSPRFFTNDELFVFSHGVADPELTRRSLDEVAPDWFDGVQFANNPDILLELLAGKTEGVFHPVCGREAFKSAIAARLAPGHGFLSNLRTGIAMLDESELDEIAERAARRLRDQLGQLHGRMQDRKRLRIARWRRRKAGGRKAG